MNVTASENCEADDSITTFPDVFMLVAVEPEGKRFPRIVMFPEAEVEAVAPILVVAVQPPSSPRAPLSIVMFPDVEITSAAAR